MRSRLAALTGRLALRHHADAAGALLLRSGGADAWVGVLHTRLASSLAAGPLTPPPPAWRAPAWRHPGRMYSSSSSPAEEEPSTPALTLTPAAADRIRDLLSRPDARAAGHTGLRLTVEAGGCSGFSYVFALDTGPQKGDTVVRGGGGDGATHPPLLIIDPVSLELVRGGTVDFVAELIKAGFEVTANPNADAGCGCGASFTPKM